ncbi:MAG: quinolinate synthase NadA [Promethearchaeota archaeon]
MKIPKENWSYISKLPKKDQELISEILKLKEKNNVLILAHNYQSEPIQLIADLLGDSLALARSAQKEKGADYIMLCGVKFMAETAAILNPDKKIIFPEKHSLCSMAAYVNAEKLRKYKEKNPGIPIMLYINSTAETKTEADVICTSSNAIHIAKIIQKQFNSEKIAFSPDKNLGRYVSEKTGIPMDIIPEEGNCYVHDKYTIQHVKDAKKKMPNGLLLVHPEAPKEVLDYADFIGSTSQIIKYATESNYNEFIIGTEIGVNDLLKRKCPDKKFIPLCEDLYCIAMKRITLNSVLRALKHLGDEEYLIKVDENIALKAYDAIKKMMDLSKSIK